MSRTRIRQIAGYSTQSSRVALAIVCETTTWFVECWVSLVETTMADDVAAAVVAVAVPCTWHREIAQDLMVAVVAAAAADIEIVSVDAIVMFAWY